MNCPCGYCHNVDSDTACRQCGSPWPPLPRGEDARRQPPPRGRPSRGRPAGGRGRPGRPVPQRRHLLVAALTPPRLLRPGRSLAFGRDKGCEFVIPSKRVSREHAEIFWREGFPILRTLSESSPTLVNGQAIKEHELRDGDEIQIGPFTCTYRNLAPGERLAIEAEPEGATEVDAEPAAMEGDLSKLGLEALLLTFENQEKTGTLFLTQGTEEGHIVLEKGRFESANLGDETDAAAVSALLGWRTGSFRLSNEKVSRPFKIIRKFDYSGAPAASTGQRFKGLRISRFLDQLDR